MRNKVRDKVIAKGNSASIAAGAHTKNKYFKQFKSSQTLVTTDHLFNLFLSSLVGVVWYMWVDVTTKAACQLHVKYPSPLSASLPLTAQFRFFAVRLSVFNYSRPPGLFIHGNASAYPKNTTVNSKPLN